MRVQELFDLTGKAAVVTGGGRGIGRFIAQGLAEAGADVVLASRKLERCEQAANDIRTLGRKALAVRCDMASVEDIDALVAAAMSAFGRIDVLVNNAGVTWGAPTLEYPLDKWERVMAVNVRGPFVLAQKVAKLMIPQGAGKIINVSSVMGLAGAHEESHPAVAYNASKGALVTLTKDLAVKFARHNIQVNAIAPGFFATDMMAWVEADVHMETKQALLAEIPMGRGGTETDIKGLAVFLASAASNYVSGEVIRVDGGFLAK
jgi:gluconate 5-dehydrogenase